MSENNMNVMPERYAVPDGTEDADGKETAGS